MSIPKGRRRVRGVRWGSPLRIVLVAAVFAMVFAGVPVALSRLHAAPAAPAAARPAANPPLSVAWLNRHPQSALDVQGVADVVIDVDTRQVLWQRQPHARRAPASLT